MTRRAYFVPAAAAAVLFMIAGPARAQPTLEYNVKAALLLNFARFIEWPEGAFASAASPIEICVVAPNPFGDALERTLQGESVGSRPLVSREVRNAADSAGCHVLFVPASAEAQTPGLVRQSGPHAVTVGESSRFEERGGAITFLLEGGRLRFSVNLHPVEERGVRISARMLRLASRVDRVTPAK